METNKIVKGNAYELIKEIPSKSVDLIYTDPPYLIRHGGGGNSGVSKRIQKINQCDLANIRDGIDYSILDEFCRVLKHIYIYIYGAVKTKYMTICTIS